MVVGEKITRVPSSAFLGCDMYHSLYRIVTVVYISVYYDNLLIVSVTKYKNTLKHLNVYRKIQLSIYIICILVYDGYNKSILNLFLPVMLSTLTTNRDACRLM
ncbi:MAG: hypothetical protein H6Q59_767 [Firmicutes bacterium]|nr:hypothetical protein [Bacillota bacterium]